MLLSALSAALVFNEKAVSETDRKSTNTFADLGHHTRSPLIDPTCAHWAHTHHCLSVCLSSCVCLDVTKNGWKTWQVTFFFNQVT